MGLFSKKAKKNKEFSEAIKKIEKDEKKWEKDVKAYREEHKEEIQRSVKAEDEINECIKDERILVSGGSSFAIMAECSVVKNAKEVANILSANPAEIGQKCKEFKPTLLIVMYDEPDLIAFAQKIMEFYPTVSILALIREPDSLTSSALELKKAHIAGVAKRPCSTEEFAKVLKIIKQSM